MDETELMDADAVADAFRRLADSVRAAAWDGPLVLVGIHTRGVEVARRLADLLGGPNPPALGTLDISLYRDDLGARGTLPVLRGSEIPGPVDGARVILCDDVLFTGRTIRAALDGIMAHGRPARIELAVLADRGGRELPIQADHVGLRLGPPDPGRRIQVRLAGVDGHDSVVHLPSQPTATP